MEETWRIGGETEVKSSFYAGECGGNGGGIEEESVRSHWAVFTCDFSLETKGLNKA